MTTMKRISWIVPAMALVGAAAWGEIQIDESVPATPGGVVTIEDEATGGKIQVIGWEEERVSVTGTLGSGAEGLEISRDGREVSIEIERPSRHRRERGEHASNLEVHVPRSSDVQIDTLQATIEVRGVTGRVEAESVSGVISIQGAPKEVEAESVSGDIIVVAAAAGVEAESVSGRIVLRGVSPWVEAGSVSGSVVVEAVSLEEGEIESHSGDVRITASLAPEGSLDVECFSGSVELSLPTEVSASFHVSSFSGKVESAFGELQRSDREDPEHEFSFSVGEGGFRVSVETFSGDVRVKKQ